MSNFDVSPPRVSACLLTFNHANIVTETIRSVLDQEFEDFELILSDDCSTDETWRICQDFAASDVRVRAVQTPKNLGMAGNANFAVSHSRAPYLALLHHDDLCAPDLLTRWVDVMDRYPDVGFVANDFAFEGREVGYSSPFSEHNDGRTILERHVFPSWPCPFRGTGLIRRSAWDAVGGIRERFGMLADVDLWMRLLAHFSVGYVAAPVIMLRDRRPSYYPKEYTSWSWHVTKLLYDIHGTNRAEYYSDATPTNKLRHLYFRYRVSADVAKWLAYGIAKKRWDMLASSSEVATEYELAPVKLGRILLEASVRLLAAHTDMLK